MLTETDEGRGTVKVFWQDVRQRVAKVDKKFADLVDEVDPDKRLPLFLAYYPYGAIQGDTISPFLPKVEGEHYRLTDPSAPRDIIKHLGYGIGSCPFTLILEKNMEFFIDLKKQRISIPWLIYTPGMFFPLSRILSRELTRVYAPNGILTTTSGARSVFMLPNIGAATNHANLQRDFNVQLRAPKILYDHWAIFREITNSRLVNCDWRSCVLFFSQEWIDHIHHDPAWTRIKAYLYEQGWRYSEYRRNHFYYELIFSLIQQKRNLRPNPYLADTARHLFTTALGCAPGYAPAADENSVPLSTLHNAFVSSYGMRKYIPTIIQPATFNYETDALPIYYSLQTPSTHVFSPRSRTDARILYELRELEHVVRIFTEELAEGNRLCSDTVMCDAAKNIQFSYFHNVDDQHHVANLTDRINEQDSRFNFATPCSHLKEAVFAKDAPFLRGCIRITRKKTE